MTGANELKLNRDLLDRNFEGYKLSLSPVAVYKEDITAGVEVLRPNDDQYSFLHHREFSLHNHLYGDLWNKDVVYFIDSQGYIRRSWINELERLEKTLTVWEIPKVKLKNAGHYNCSLHFASAHIAVVCDGAGTLYVIDTSSREDVIPWKLPQKIHKRFNKINICINYQNACDSVIRNPNVLKVLHSDDILGEGIAYKIEDARCVNESPNRIVNCILLHIGPQAENNDISYSENSSAKFETILNWATLTEEITGFWSKKSVNVIKGKGILEYIALEPNCKGLYIVSDIAIDAYEQPTSTEKMESEEEKPQQNPDYFWQQTFDDIKLWMNLPDDTNKKDIIIKSIDQKIDICIRGSSILSGKLTNAIDHMLTTWSFNNKRLEIVLQKLAEGTMWTQFLETNKKGKEIVNEEIAADIHKKLAHLCSEDEEGDGSTFLNSGQLEECDAFDGVTRTLYRLEADTCMTTHKVVIGSQQWLLNSPLCVDQVPAFCVRNDVDGCVWQPKEPEIAGPKWDCEHVGTFHAFGYIQASKQNKKFTSAPSDLSYIAIVDVSGHVMLYRKGVVVSGELRNRKTGKNLTTVAVQNLINLQTNNEILGAFASNKYFFVLTEKSLHVIHCC